MSARRIGQHCPYCGENMTPVAMHCPACRLEVRGEFRQTLFQHLPGEDLELLQDYLLAGFSIKALEERVGMGYAALRTRIDRLIANYEQLVREDARRTAILDALAAGQLSAGEAARQLHTEGTKGETA